MVSKHLDRMWVTPKFRQTVYSLKAVEPDKKLTEIIDDISDREKQRLHKNGVFPKF